MYSKSEVAPKSQRYFAYGSNLNRADWARWCQKKGFAPSIIRPCGTAVLPDYKIVFGFNSITRKGGVLDVRSSPGSTVDGVLFEVDDIGWQALDMKEGYNRANNHSSAYRSITCSVLTPEGNEELVSTYVVDESQRQEYVKPHPEYFETCKTGLESFDLSSENLKLAAENKPTKPLSNLFVYGTLMRGEKRFSVLLGRSPSCILVAHVRGNLYNLGSYPGLDLEGDEGTVRGEFIMVPDEQIPTLLHELDHIEGFAGFGTNGNLFKRKLVLADVGQGRPRLSWAYIMEGHKGQKIESGCWRVETSRWTDFASSILQKHAEGVEDFYGRLARSLSPFENIEPDDTLSKANALAGLADGSIPERRMAQVSHRWVVLP